jgi:superfamily II DNA or RNA helicase
VGATGFGKTRVALKIIKWLQSLHPEITIIVVVPTTGLQEQWIEELDKFGCSREHVEVYVINSVIKNTHTCNLLILDECHRYASADFKKVFDMVTYNMILCLTATFERLDGKEKLIAKYAPVVDKVSIQECLANKWVSNYKEYVVVIEPDDLDEYDKLTAEFMTHFEFFDYDFGTAMSMVGKNGWKNRYNYAKEICQNSALVKDTLKTVTIHAMGLMRAMQTRKKYISSHPEKLRVAEEIIAHRPNSKIITFCATVAMAEQIQEGYVYTGKDSKKGNRVTLNEFSKMKSGVLNTVKKANEGINLPDLDVGIMLGVDSSKIKHAQTRGRVVRYQEGKNAEYFTLILKDTVEVEWWRRSQGKDSCEVIDEDNLMHVLNHEPYETYKEPLKQFVSNA